MTSAPWGRLSGNSSPRPWRPVLSCAHSPRLLLPSSVPAMSPSWAYPHRGFPPEAAVRRPPRSSAADVRSSLSLHGPQPCAPQGRGKHQGPHLQQASQAHHLPGQFQTHRHREPADIFPVLPLRCECPLLRHLSHAHRTGRPRLRCAVRKCSTSPFPGGSPRYSGRAPLCDASSIIPYRRERYPGRRPRARLVPGGISCGKAVPQPFDR